MYKIVFTLYSHRLFFPQCPQLSLFSCYSVCCRCGTGGRRVLPLCSGWCGGPGFQSECYLLAQEQNQSDCSLKWKAIKMCTHDLQYILFRISRHLLRIFKKIFQELENDWKLFNNFLMFLHLKVKSSIQNLRKYWWPKLFL